MKNAEKIMPALKEAFSGHRVEMLYVANGCFYRIFVDNNYIGDFFGEFFERDIDNPEIEIKIKAPLVSIKDFTNCIGGYEIIRAAVKRGLREWEEGSLANN